ncbi:hypothetical protein G8770_03490 [Aestuariicella hydrocarbonica]|uniref:Phage abortive infection protein n=1 Tax=Pseudomaricurvus hydrocarbonicus TaxID=1470433 RepID=A0A9E5JQ74_9GAMM|nr:hypothetical protein [Aestuariicella hydrocarbonica]NHO64608.1 hypothetical protein [Aestuariicella hydrocarbonica]
MEEPKNNPTSVDNDLLESTSWGVVVIPVLLILVYFIWFYAINGKGLSENPSDWGTFGDYLGGIINPLIAFFALMWLVKSVRIQRIELQATRKELKEAAQAQLRTAIHYEDMKKIEDCRVYVESMTKMAFESKLIASGYNGSLPNNCILYSKEIILKLRKEFRDENLEELKDISYKVQSIKGGLEAWALAHGDQHCYAVEYHKAYMKDFVIALWSLLLIDDDAVLFFTNQANIYSDMLENWRLKRDKLNDHIHGSNFAVSDTL